MEGRMMIDEESIKEHISLWAKVKREEVRGESKKKFTGLGKYFLNKYVFR
ncbi:MAG: hypothetical protein IIB05_04200 [Bacteroidetes bacterium]|nr:hypothetical protein [Bacteroidota bacterium]